MIVLVICCLTVLCNRSFSKPINHRLRSTDFFFVVMLFTQFEWANFNGIQRNGIEAWQTWATFISLEATLVIQENLAFWSNYTRKTFKIEKKNCFQDCFIALLNSRVTSALKRYQGEQWQIQTRSFIFLGMFAAKLFWNYSLKLREFPPREARRNFPELPSGNFATEWRASPNLFFTSEKSACFCV